MANACPFGSATSIFFDIVFSELFEYILIEVAENIYYYFYVNVVIYIFSRSINSYLTKY